MVEIWLPYGASEVHISVPINDLLGVVEPHPAQPAQDPKSEVSKSLRNPIDGQNLKDVLTSSSNVALAVEGSIKPSLAVTVTDAIIEELHTYGVQNENVTIILGNGDRETGNLDLAATLQAWPTLQGIKLSEFMMGSTSVVNKGATSRKTKLEVSAQYASADFRIAIGEVSLDPFSGFSGAQNAVIPGLASIDTLESIRGLAFDVKAAPGSVEGNPVLAETLDAASLAGIDMAVNLVSNSKGELLRAYAGRLEESWRKALADVGESHLIRVEANADIIVASAGGIRFDFDLYHAIWALRNLSQIARKGAVIILLAECSEGLGVAGISRLSHIDILSELKRRYTLGGEAVYLVKSMIRSNEIFLVSALPENMTEPLGLKTSKTANDALRAATAGHRRRRVLAVTHARSTLPFLERKKGDEGQDDHGEVEKGEQLS